MTSAIHKERNYILLLLNTHRNQSIALLKTITENQTNSISEVFYNIFERNIDVEESVMDIIKKRSYVLRDISNSGVSNYKRALCISKHARLVLNSILLVKDTIEKELDNDE